MKPDERYTCRTICGELTATALCKDITSSEAICQLADYEDTGLNPTEINSLVDMIERDRDSCSDIVSVYLDKILDMISDINPAEIASHIEENELKEWCDTWENNMIMLFIKIRHYYETSYKKSIPQMKKIKKYFEYFSEE